MEMLKKFKEKARNPKVQLGVGLAVAAIGLMAPKESHSKNYCQPGGNGNCGLITNGDKHCVVQGFTHNCT